MIIQGTLACEVSVECHGFDLVWGATYRGVQLSFFQLGAELSPFQLFFPDQSPQSCSAYLVTPRGRPGATSVTPILITNINRPSELIFSFVRCDVPFPLI